jgi:hypothetical protein
MLLRAAVSICSVSAARIRKRGSEISSPLNLSSGSGVWGDSSPSGVLGVTSTMPLIENVKTFLFGGSKSLIFRCSVMGKDGRGASDSDCTTEEALVVSLVSFSVVV